MDEALSHWLRLREPCDVAARSKELTRAIADTVPVGEPVYILDLATGEGSNVRFLADWLPGPQHWLAVDRSPTLLRGLCERISSWGKERGYTVRTDTDRCRLHGADIECDVETRQVDLGALDRHDIFARRHLVTASALLDLVSTRWLRALVAHCQKERASALFTISYNGHFSCAPADAEDGLVRDLMNEHQKTDKGLGGPAAGPDAVARAVPRPVRAKRLGAGAGGARRPARARRRLGGSSDGDRARPHLDHRRLASAPAGTRRGRPIAGDCWTRRSCRMAAARVGHA